MYKITTIKDNEMNHHYTKKPTFLKDNLIKNGHEVISTEKATDEELSHLSKVISVEPKPGIEITKFRK